MPDRVARLVRAVTLALALTGAVPAFADPASAGAAIYRRGMLPSGAPLIAEREGGVRIEGAAAACINCHRRSGLGMKEGLRTIPPVAGSYLFHPRASNADELDLPFVEGMRADRDPYTEASLAQAIREGVGADGKPLSYLMPHYSLDEAAMSELVAHLKSLSPGAVPGVTDTVLHFATIITPDADPVLRKGMLEVLDKFFIDKNQRTAAESPRLRSTRRMMFRANRHWELHVWQLSGPPQTWDRQLRARLAAEPVFAVISGLGGRTWAPVHKFCEEAALPCLFPNVDLPVVAERDFDSLYLSRGVLLEAQLMAHALKERTAGESPHRLVQIYREADVGKEASEALAMAFAGSGIKIVDRSLAAHAPPGQLQAMLRSTEADDVLILWLRPADLAALGHPPGKLGQVFLSGRMAGLERAPLPSGWRAITHMAYPFDLPDQRRVRVDFPLGWFRIRAIPVVAEQLQADTFLVCGLVSETLNHMADTFVRDYLVERIESMLEHRVITGYYPRLALGAGQRFASKGGYMVHFAEASGNRVVAEGDWIVP